MDHNNEFGPSILEKIAGIIDNLYQAHKSIQELHRASSIAATIEQSAARILRWRLKAYPPKRIFRDRSLPRKRRDERKHANFLLCMEFPFVASSVLAELSKPLPRWDLKTGCGPARASLQMVPCGDEGNFRRIEKIILDPSNIKGALVFPPPRLLSEVVKGTPIVDGYYDWQFKYGIGGIRIPVPIESIPPEDRLDKNWKSICDLYGVDPNEIPPAPTTFDNNSKEIIGS